MGDVKFDLEDRLVEFSCRIIELVELLPYESRSLYRGPGDKMRIGSGLIIWRGPGRGHARRLSPYHENCSKGIKRNKSLFKDDFKSQNDFTGREIKYY